VYDMYPWNTPASAARSSSPASTAGAAPARSSAASAGSAAAPAPEPSWVTEGAQAAVQVALDRRDNGGDASGAVAAAHRPTAGPTRQ
jgi:hypothetical protein